MIIRQTVLCLKGDNTMIKIGLLICCSDNYFAQEYKIPESYTKGVDTLAKQLDAQILPYAPVKDAYPVCSLQ